MRDIFVVLVCCVTTSFLAACGQCESGSCQPPVTECSTNVCPACPDGTTHVGNHCYLPSYCPEGSSFTSDGRCLRPPSCPIPLTDGLCSVEPTCPIPLTDGQCLLTPECPEGTTYEDGSCYLDPKCPEGTEMRDGSCYPPVVCPEGYVLEDGTCQLVLCELGDYPAQDDCACDYGNGQYLRNDGRCCKVVGSNLTALTLNYNEPRDGACHCYCTRDPCTQECISCYGDSCASNAPNNGQCPTH